METVEKQALSLGQKAFGVSFVGIIVMFWMWAAAFMLKMSYSMIVGLYKWIKENR